MSVPLPERSRRIALLMRKKMLKKYMNCVREEDRMVVAFLLAAVLAEFDVIFSEATRGTEPKKKTLFGQKSADTFEMEASRKKYFEEEFENEYRFFVDSRITSPAEMFRNFLGWGSLSVAQSAS